MFVLRTVLALAAASAIGVATANAADLPSRSSPYAPTPAYSPALSNWQGFYVGAHLGGGFGSVGAVDTSGFVGGVQGGFNAQFDRFVAGIEGDVSLSNVGNSGFTEKATHDWFGSVRGRAGYSFGNIMAFGTLGLAFADVKYRNIFGSTSDSVMGWTIGAGAEMMVTNNITLRAEYLRYELGSNDYPVPGGFTKVDSNINVIRAGVNYKF